MTSGTQPLDPRRCRLASRALALIGSALLLVAGIHLAITPLLRRSVLLDVLTPDTLRIVEGPFLLNHVVVGILLVPLGLTTLFAASGLRSGARWAWTLASLNATGILGMPLALLCFARFGQMNAPAFLIAASLVTLAGIGVVWVLWWVRRGGSRGTPAGPGRA